jgi:hypothetical protein
MRVLKLFIPVIFEVGTGIIKSDMLDPKHIAPQITPIERCVILICECGPNLLTCVAPFLVLYILLSVSVPRAYSNAGTR